MTRTTRFATLVLLILVGGCAPRHVKITPPAYQGLNGQAVQALTYAPPVVKTVSTKNVTDLALSNPALEVQEKFLKTLKSDGHITRYLDATKDFSDQKDSSLKQLATKFHEGVVFDFKTLSWGYVHYPLDRVHDRVFYTLRARLIQFPEAKVLWQAGCRIKDDDLSDQKSSLNSLLANNGEILKSKLSRAASRCSQQLAKKFSELAQPSKIIPSETLPSTRDAVQPVEPAQPVKPAPVEPKENKPTKTKPSVATGGRCQTAPEGLAKLYPVERCEVEVLAKRCGAGDRCMIGCYLSRKGEKTLGGCYQICNIYRRGWKIPDEWRDCNKP